MGSGARQLGDSLLREGVREAVLLLSHLHLDHINGFPFFSPAFRDDFSLRIIAGHQGTETVLSDYMGPPFFPVPLRRMRGRLRFESIDPGDGLCLDGEVRVRTAPLFHPGGATGYRIEHRGLSLCYVTDTGHVPGHLNADILNLIAGADLVLYDSTLSEKEFAEKPNWGHSTWNEGVRLCRAASAKRLGLFHHDPDRDDKAMAELERQAQAEWPEVFAAREGGQVILV